MNIALSPQTIPIPWQDYLARKYDRSLIPWPRYRYSGTGVIEVGNELTRNVRIAQKLLLKLLDQPGEHGVYTNSISVEVERSKKEERIPDVLVVSEECDTCFTQASQRLLDDAPGIVTLDMPAPILVMEVISPSSVTADLEEKPFEMMERGVKEYVYIDWRKEIIQVWSNNDDGSSYNFVEYKAGEVVGLKSFPALTVSVEQMILK